MHDGEILGFLFLGYLLGFFNHWIVSLIKARKARQQKPTEQDTTAAIIELEKLKISERTQRMEMKERLLLEKYDIIKTAVAMGYGELELSKLDERLKTAIREKIEDENEEEVSAGSLIDRDLLEKDVRAEIERLEKLGKQKSKS